MFVVWKNDKVAPVLENADPEQLVPVLSFINLRY